MCELLDKIYVASTVKNATRRVSQIIHVGQQSIFERSLVFISENIKSVPLFSCMIKTPLEMYKCEKCGFEAYLKVNLKVHMEMFHQLNIPYSLDCFRSFSDDNYNLSNILKCYNCETCDFATHSLLVLLKHQSTNHKLKKTKPSVIQNRKKVDHAAFKNLRKVYTKSLNSKWFNCEQCPFITKCKYRLKNHIHINHRLPEDGQLYECTECSFKTTFKCRLNSHKIVHDKNLELKVFRCSFCSHITRTKYLLNSHIMHRHTAEEEVRKFSCTYCPYRAKQKSTLTMHIVAKHTSEEDINWFMCEICSFKCKRKTHLRQHMVKHSENKLILCEMCSAQFKRVSNLKQHMLCKHKIKM